MRLQFCLWVWHFDPKAEFSQPFLCEVYLPVFKGIFVARELIAISGEQAAEVEPIALRLVIGHETCGGGKKEQAIVAVQNAFGVRAPRHLSPDSLWTKPPLSTA